MSENTRIHDLPDEQRPREKMANLGAGALSNEELLAIFLRTGTKGSSAIEIGRQLITKHGSVAALAKLDLHELCKEHGLGLAKACQLQAAFELGSRAVREGSKSTPLKNSQNIYDFLALQLLWKNHRTRLPRQTHNYPFLLQGPEMAHRRGLAGESKVRLNFTGRGHYPGLALGNLEKI